MAEVKDEEVLDEMVRGRRGFWAQVGAGGSCACVCFAGLQNLDAMFDASVKKKKKKKKDKDKKKDKRGAWRAVWVSPLRGAWGSGRDACLHGGASRCRRAVRR